MTANDYVTVAGAAEIASVTERAIRAAIDRGELHATPTRCKRTKLIAYKSACEWAQSTRKRGRKPKVIS